MIGLSPHERDPLKSLENYRASYDFYRGKPISPSVSTFAHFVLARYYHPSATYLGEAQQQTYDHLSANKNLLFAISHTRADDPFAAAALLQREKALQKARRNVVVLGKEPVSHTLEDKHPLLNTGVRLILDNFIMLKVFRKDDYLDGDEAEEYKNYIAGLVDPAGDLVVDESIARLDDNTNVAVFPEGTRREEFSKVAPLFDGIADIALGSVRSNELLVLPMSIDYGENKENLRRPDVVMGELIPIQGEKPELLAAIHAGMQECVDHTPRLLQAA